MNKLTWIIKRHPLLYYLRFKLLSKNSTIEKINSYSYNTLNIKESIPKLFYEINSKIFNQKQSLTDIDKVIKLSCWLSKNIVGGSGLSVSSDVALKKMLNGEGGVCSDMTQIVNNFCVINDIKVKEWGITIKPYNNKFGGHAFNEFYSKELQKWFLLDASKCTLFYLENSDIPLSVIELFQLNKTHTKVVYDSFLELNSKDRLRIESFFLNPYTVPFLICNYNNSTYDKYLNRLQPYLPIFMIHFTLYLFRKSYYYEFPLDDCRKLFVKNNGN